MKTLNLENLSEQEMDAKEMKEVDGGVWPTIIRVGIAIYKTGEYVKSWSSSEIHGNELRDNTRVVRHLVPLA